MEPKRAVIDIGSNTVRLVIYGGPPRAPATLFNEKVTARLGRGVAQDGRLTPKAMAQALAALARYAAILRIEGIAQAQTVATAAVRDAANGAEFLERVAALGLAPRLLSGEEEAQASAMGVIAAFPGARGLVADLGGGSLELVGMKDGRPQGGVTLPLGSLRLSALREADPAGFRRNLAGALPKALQALASGQTLYLVGGSHRALAHFAIEQDRWPLDDPHGLALEPQAALRHCRTLLARGAPAAIAGVSNSRLQALPDTAALMAALLKRLEPARLVFSSWGLREGLLHAALPAQTRAADPLLAGVEAFALALGVAPERGRRAAEWIAPAVPLSGPDEARLLRAAASLALASQKVEPNLRAAEVLYWALRKRWIGLDAPARAMLAAALHAQTGRFDLPAELARLRPEADLRRAQAWGAAIRLCRRFTLASPGALAESRLTAGHGRLVLSFAPGLAALAGDPVEKDLRGLAGLLGLAPELNPEPAV